LESILEQVMELVREGRTNKVVLLTFFNRRIQPLRVWAHGSPKELTDMEVDAHIKRVLELSVMIDIGPYPALMH
jgi:hypothetical protein